jgi:hypothetical protein
VDFFTFLGYARGRFNAPKNIALFAKGLIGDRSHLDPDCILDALAIDF